MRKLKKYCTHNFPEKSRRHDIGTTEEMVYQCSECRGFLIIIKEPYRPIDYLAKKFHKGFSARWMENRVACDICGFGHCPIGKDRGGPCYPKKK